MKAIKIKQILSLLLIGGAFIGCESDYLDKIPKDKISSTTFWKTAKDAKYALIGCYAFIESGFNDAYKDGYADNAYCQYPWESNATLISAGDIDANMNDGYNYEGIRRFNYFIDNIDKAPLSDDLKKQYKAEVKTLRAWRYFNLAQKFGDIPLITKYIIDAEDAKIRPTAELEVIKFVINELNDAIQDLPEKAELKSRISKAAAYALKARVHLYYQQWSEAANSANEVMKLGYELFKVSSLSSNDLTDDYSKFMTFANNSERDAFYKGLRSYEQLFWDANTGNSEVILEVEYLKGSPWEWSNGINTLFLADNAGGGWSSITPTQELVNAYWKRDGSKFTPISAQDRATLYNKGNYNSDFLEEFRNRDTRLYASILFPGAMMNSLSSGFVFSWAKGGSNISASGYNFRKLVDPTDPSYTSNWEGPQNYPAIRYAEVLLTYAEAKNEASGPDASIYDALDLIRERVAMPKIDRVAINTKELLRELIRNERRIELAAEGFRWDDIKRWNISKDVMKNTYSIDNDLVQTRRWEERFKRLPYPQTAIDRNPNLIDAQKAKGY